MDIRVMPYMKQSDMERLSSAKRVHLRRALGIFYPLSREVKAEDIYTMMSQCSLEVDVGH